MKILKDKIKTETRIHLNNLVNLKNVEFTIPIEILEDFFIMEDIFNNSKNKEPFDLFHEKIIEKVSNKKEYPKELYDSRVGIASILWQIKGITRIIDVYPFDNFEHFYDNAKVTLYRGFPFELDRVKRYYSFTSNFEYAKKFTNKDFARIGAIPNLNYKKGYVIKTTIPLKYIKLYNNEMWEDEFVIDQVTYNQFNKEYIKIN